MSVLVGVYKLSEDAVSPFKGTELAACYDLCACFHHNSVKFHNRREKIFVEEDHKGKFITLYPGDMALIPLGLIFCLPVTHHLKFYSRSGNVLKRFLTVANQPAVIDSDYTNESFVLLHNNSVNPQNIRHGDKIAQCEICENKSMELFNVNDEQFDIFRKGIVDLSKKKEMVD